MTDHTQRWHERREYFRARAADFDPRAYVVEPIPDDRTARGFVERHHYAGTMPPARFRVGLYERRAFFAPELLGVAVFSVPMQAATVPAYAPGLEPREGVELGRFVLHAAVPYNGETFLLRHAFRLLHAALPEVRIVVSYSDPVERADAEGRVVKPGHWGAIYQGKGARFVGRAKAETLWLDRAGRVLSRRSLSKLRNDERGAAGAYARLLAAGAPPRHPFEDGTAYVTRALAEGPFRRLRHPGNLCYLFGPLGTAAGLPASSPPALPYPKKGRAA